MIVEAALGLIVLVAGCGGVGVGIAWLNDRRHAANAKRLPPEDARQILERRFAKGEIDSDEFSRRMHALTYGPPLELDHPN